MTTLKVFYANHFYWFYEGVSALLLKKCPVVRARGYFVSTIGLDECIVREYTRNQEKQDEHQD